MIKPLLKKQLLETASFFFLGRKDGKRRKPLAVFGVCALILYAVGAMVFLFWEMSKTLCLPLVANGMAWVYFAFMGIMAVGFSCIGSVFAAKSRLFEAKDNDFLLSLPLPPWAILFSRMLSLYALAFACGALVFVPAFVQYFLVTGFAALPLFFGVALLLLMPLLSLAVCSLLGWLIAFLTARLRAKNLLTMLLFVGFMFLYFWLVGKMNEYLVYVIANGEAVGAKIKATLYPFWQLGLAAAGDPLALLIFALLSVGAFALVYLLLTKTFFAVTTVKRGEKKRKYRAKAGRATSVRFALLKREFLRVIKNPMIFLNAGMGTVLSVVSLVLVLFNIEFCKTLADALGGQEVCSLAVTLLCFIASSNTFTASSVSLEGENLWIVRSSPVRTGEILRAKLYAHLCLTALPALVVAALVLPLFGVELAAAVCGVLTVLAIAVFCGAVGLALNLKLPNLHWTNEVAAVKQSYAALLSMFVGWGASALIVGGWFWFGKNLPLWGYFGLCALTFALGSALLVWWLKARGERAFEEL